MKSPQPASPLRIVGGAIIGGIVGLIGGIILGVAAYVLIGILTWSSDTGVAVGWLVGALICVMGPVAGAVEGSYHRPTYGQFCTDSGKMLNEYGTAPLQLLFASSTIALALLIGWIISLCMGWIGWWGSVVLLLLACGFAGFSFDSWNGWINPSAPVSVGSSQPAGTKRVYDSHGNVTGYVDE